MSEDSVFPMVPLDLGRRLACSVGRCGLCGRQTLCRDFHSGNGWESANFQRVEMQHAPWSLAGIVVHVTAGFSALASLSIVGHREIPEDEKHIHETPHNIPFVALGTALLWFGWFGFNGGRQTARRDPD